MIEGRSLYEPQLMRDLGIDHEDIGRGNAGGKF